MALAKVVFKTELKRNIEDEHRIQGSRAERPWLLITVQEEESNMEAN